MKKLISLILSVLMLSCLIVVPSFAEEVEAKVREALASAGEQD